MIYRTTPPDRVIGWIAALTSRNWLALSRIPRIYLGANHHCSIRTSLSLSLSSSSLSRGQGIVIPPVEVDLFSRTLGRFPGTDVIAVVVVVSFRFSFVSRSDCCWARAGNSIRFFLRFLLFLRSTSFGNHRRRHSCSLPPPLSLSPFLSLSLTQVYLSNSNDSTNKMGAQTGGVSAKMTFGPYRRSTKVSIMETKETMGLGHRRNIN